MVVRRLGVAFEDLLDRRIVDGVHQLAQLHLEILFLFHGQFQALAHVRLGEQAALLLGQPVVVAAVSLIHEPVEGRQVVSGIDVVKAAGMIPLLAGEEFEYLP